MNAYHQAIGGGAHIVASAVFNRPSWGADEALTHFLVAQLEADWRHAMDEEIDAQAHRQEGTIPKPPLH